MSKIFCGVGSSNISSSSSSTCSSSSGGGGGGGGSSGSSCVTDMIKCRYQLGKCWSTIQILLSAVSVIVYSLNSLVTEQ